jgi:hypothetical protein
MTYENIDPTLIEINIMADPIRKMLASSIQASNQAIVELAFVKKFQSIEKYLNDLLEGIKNVPEEKKVSALTEGLTTLSSFCKNEQKVLNENVIKASEKIKTLQDVVGHIDTHTMQLANKKKAIERVAFEETDPKHPEKISVQREAEKLKKSRKQEE